MKINYTSNPIPVKPYVKKFIENGNNIKPYILNAIYILFCKHQEDELIPFNEGVPYVFKTAKPTYIKFGPDNDTYKLLSSTIAGESPISSPHKWQKVIKDECTIKFPLPQRVFETNGWALSPQNVIRFNNLLEGYIKDRFECELEANIRRSLKIEEKFPIQEMILDLRKKFGLEEEDMPFETIKKSLQRFCERENIDLQVIKIYYKSVPKKRVVITTTHNTVSSAEFRRVLDIHPNTYTRLKKKLELVTYRTKDGDMIDLDLSVLPSHIKYMIKTSS